MTCHGEIFSTEWIQGYPDRAGSNFFKMVTVVVNVFSEIPQSIV